MFLDLSGACFAGAHREPLKVREIGEIDNSYRTIFQKEEKKVSTEPYLKELIGRGGTL